VVVVVDQDQDPIMQEDLVVHRVVDLTVKQQLQEQHQLTDILEKRMQYLLLLDGVVLVVLVSLANLIQKVVEVVAPVVLVVKEEEIQEEMVVQALHIQSVDHQ
jgi:hypothetical protein|tara:strand:- start:5 stop:313 length:309 start_codon:yes stop_codon:yes gene_type:complete